MYELKQVLEGKPFVREIESLHEERRKFLFLRYSKIILSDFSSLHIKEIWKNGEISKYSYYWFSAGSNLILGWDNAPHHINVTSFPHHRHTVDGVEPAEERNLPDVLEYLGNIF